MKEAIEAQIDVYKTRLADTLQQVAQAETTAEEGRVRAHQLRGAVAALSQLLQSLAQPQATNGLDRANEEPANA